MKKLALVCVAVLLSASLASAAIITLDITTDKVLYAPGETVQWTLSAWASQSDNHGLSLLSVTLTEDQGDVLNPADTEFPFPFPFDTLEQLKDSEYRLTEGFNTWKKGTSDGAGTLADVLVGQDPAVPTYNIGNQGAPRIVAVGGFVVNTMGWHVLSADVTGGAAANYYPDETGGNPATFENLLNDSVDYEVAPEPATLMLLGLGGIALLRRRK